MTQELSVPPQFGVQKAASGHSYRQRTHTHTHTTVDSVTSLSHYHRSIVNMFYQYYVPAGCGFCYMLFNYALLFWPPLFRASLQSVSQQLTTAIFPPNQTQEQCQLRWPSVVRQVSATFHIETRQVGLDLIVYPVGVKRSHLQNAMFQ